MPKSKLITTSTLFSDKGLVEACNLSGTVLIGGIDRSGHFSLAETVVKETQKSVENHFVGTEGAFGSFHPETKLITSKGTGYRACDLVNEDNYRNLFFENSLFVAGIKEFKMDHRIVFSYLRKHSLAETDKGKIVFHRRNPKRSSNKKYFELTKDNRHILLDEAVVKKGIESNCSGFLKSFVETAYFDVIRSDYDDVRKDIILIPVSCYLISLWFVIYSEKKCSLEYEQRQSSTTVRINNLYLQRYKLSTLFRHVKKEREIEIEWQDPSWNPLSSGFIIGPS